MLRERGTFVGRAAQLEAIGDAFDDNLRLVTLLGPGGIGKTRLASWYAAREATPGRTVVFCDLGDTRDVDDVCTHLATAAGLSISETESTDLPAALGRALASLGRCLVVLDRAETAVAAVALAVSRWLDRAPECDFLVTSREALRIAGEQIIRVPALDAADAAQLFRERAARICDADRVAGFDAGQLAQVVGRLEGNPLAICLAAARTSALSLDQLFARLEHPLDLLASRDRDVPDHHASLRAAISASWRLLGHDEQQALAECALFSGDWSLDAAEAILGAGAGALDTIDGLLGKSLLEVNEVAGQARYSMYDSVREFAAPMLSGVTDGTAARRHAEYFAGLAERHAANLDGRRALASLETLEREVANLIGAAERTADADPDLAVRAALPLARVVVLRGPSARAEALVERIVAAARAGARDRSLAMGLLAAAILLRGRGALEAALDSVSSAAELATRCGDQRLAIELQLLEIRIHIQAGRYTEADALARAVLERGDATPPETRAYATVARAVVEHVQGAIRGPDHYDDAIELCRAAGARSEVWALSGQGTLLRDAGRGDAAIEVFERARQLARATGGLRAEGASLGSIAEVHYHLGRLDEAESVWRQSLQLFRRTDYRLGEAWDDHFRALVAQERGQLEHARRLCERAHRSARECGWAVLEALTSAQRGMLALEESQPLEAARSLEAASSQLERIGDQRHASFVSALWALALTRGGQPERAAAALERARELLSRRAFVPAGQRLAIDTLAAAIEGSPLPDRRDDAGWEARLARRLAMPGTAAKQAPRPPILTVEPSGLWFEWAGTRVDLSRRGALRRVLCALADRREREPSATLDVFELLGAGWPGQEVDPESGAQRVYSAIATLRRLGLDDCLLTRDNGYLLDPTLALARSGSHAT